MEKLRSREYVNLSFVQPLEIIRDILKLLLIKGCMHSKPILNTINGQTKLSSAEIIMC